MAGAYTVRRPPRGIGPALAPERQVMKVTAGQLLKDRNRLPPNAVAALVDGRTVDLHTPVEATETTEVKPILADDPRALPIIRHSTAHVMADAVQRLFPGTKVTIGPSIDSGFYYDFDRPDGRFTEDDLGRIEATMKEIAVGDTPFVRGVMTREEAREKLTKMGETYKVEILDGIPAGEDISFYQHGSWIDLCEGPHVPSTRFLQAVKLTSVAGAYWRGDERRPMLQRIYGTAFPTQKALDAHMRQLEEAKARDHRKLGKDLKLFMFHEWAPASPFFLPRGAHLYNALIAYMRDQYARRGYSEVITPQIFDKALWETSGHWENYRDNMFLALGTDALEPTREGHGVPMSQVFTLDEKVTAALSSVSSGYICGCKAMNCPSHCLMFAADRKSYRDLPLRMADFGRLHRYERSGVTHGLSRVRTFSQDDAHIFCTEEQMPAEIGAFFDLLDEVYRDLGMTDVKIMLATRPDSGYLGTVESWERAEKILGDAVLAKGRTFEIAKGEGAFYGPKLEFHITDAIGRSWQLGTLQVDPNLPERFDLSYIGADNTAHRPVMLHRAVLGSLERFLSLYIEHTAGWFPAWLSPEQIVLVTVSDKHLEFAESLAARMRLAGLRVEVDPSNEKLTAKIRNASLLRPPYIGVIGDKEVESDGATLRKGRTDLGFMPAADLIAKLRAESVAPSRAPA
jgi:threonyl-tRNA synthetase